MAQASSEALSKAIRKSKRLKIVQDKKMNEFEAMALFRDAAPGGGYIQAIREVVKRKIANGDQFFLIAVLNEKNEPITDRLYGRQLAAQTNLKLSATNSPVRVRWIDTNVDGLAVNKLLAIPVEKYKESGGRE